METLKMNPQSTVLTPQSQSGPNPDCGLRVKELAESLQVSRRFIYQMRARGFPMQGDNHYGQTATVQEAQDWINANNFRLVKGVGVIGI